MVKIMNAKKVDLKLSILLEDLNNGYTWFKKEDVGYGNIQEKYNATDYQIEHIKKHPQLKDVEPNIVIFNIIDDVNVKNAKKSTESINLFANFPEEALAVENVTIKKEEGNESALFLNI
jgi:hypothetical protein